MKILMLSPIVGEAFGQERVLNDSLRLLRNAGHKVGILAERRVGDVPPHDGLWLHPGISPIHWLSKPAKVRKLHEAVLNSVELFAPDLIHLIDQFDYRLMQSLASRYPTFMTSHTVATTCPSSTRHRHSGGACEKKSGWPCLINHRHYRCLDFLKTPLHQAHAIENHLRRQKVLKSMHIGAISKYVKDCLLRDGFSEDRVHLIYNPIAVPPKKAPLKKDAPLLVSASRLSPHKGIGVFVDSLIALRHLSWEARICGVGPLKNSLQDKVRSHGLSDRIIFLGRTSYSETRALMESATALVQPNTGPEPFGLSAAEAAARGTPVIGFDIPAINEIIEDGVSGLLTDVQRPESLTESIEQILKNPLLEKHLSQEGPLAMRKRFSPEAHLEKTLEAYQMCIEAHAPTTTGAVSSRTTANETY